MIKLFAYYKIFFKTSHGHTPYLLHAYDEKFIYMADLVPTSHHVSIPWVMGYDISPGKTTIDKLNFYDFILQNNLTLIFEHDIKAWGAKIQKKNDSEFTIKELFAASDPKNLSVRLFS